LSNEGKWWSSIPSQPNVGGRNSKNKDKKKKQLEPNQENHGVQFQKNLMLKDEVKKENQCKKIDAKKKIGKKNNATQFSTNLMWNDEIYKKKLTKRKKKHQLTQWLESCEWNNLMEGKMRKLMKLNYKINKILKDKIKKIKFLKIARQYPS